MIRLLENKRNILVNFRRIITISLWEIFFVTLVFFPAFVSWIRFYSTFPRDLRKIFNIKVAHMGHHAKCLGLREAPKAFAKEANKPKPELPRNRLTVEAKRTTLFKPRTLAAITPPTPRRGTRVGASGGRFQFKEKKSYDFDRGLKTAKMLNVSEFDSGLPPLKKRRIMK